MPRPPRHLSDNDLLHAVREQLAADPNISQAELRAAIGGTQSVVSAAMRAVLVEQGRLNTGNGVTVDPRFASLIRPPEPPAPLDLRAVLTSELARPVTDHIAGISAAVDAVFARIHAAALETIDRERQAAASMIDLADRRADRAEVYVDALRREVSEALAETEKVRASNAREHGNQELQIAHLERALAETRAECAREDAAHRELLAELDAARARLGESIEKGAALDRDLVAANARVQELERIIVGVTERLAAAEEALSASRSSEAESRAAAAAARATAEAYEAIVQRLDISLIRRQAKSRPKTT